MSQDWNDPGRRVAVLQDEMRRLRARAERWGACATAAALDEALSRSSDDLPRAEITPFGRPGASTRGAGR